MNKTQEQRLMFIIVVKNKWSKYYLKIRMKRKEMVGDIRFELMTPAL